MIARGIRHHNPGNIRASSIDWEGEAKPPASETTFTVFKAPWWGIRAMVKIIDRYYHHHGLKTVAAIVGRYAPGHENPTDNYTMAVARAVGVTPSTRLTLNYYNMESMVRAMIHFENGSCPYTWEIPTGMILAGYDPQVTVLEGAVIHYGWKKNA